MTVLSSCEAVLDLAIIRRMWVVRGNQVNMKLS
jgi:hypothetical protein